MGKSKKKINEPIKSIVDDYKLNNSAYIIQDYTRRYLLSKKMKNTAEKLKQDRKVKRTTDLIEYNIKIRNPIFTPMTQEEADKAYKKGLNKQKKITNYFKKI